MQFVTALHVPAPEATPFVQLTVATPTVEPVLSWIVLLLPCVPPEYDAEQLLEPCVQLIVDAVQSDVPPPPPVWLVAR